MARYKMTLEELGPAIRWLGTLAHRNSLKAVRGSATYGKVAVGQTIKRTKDPFRIRASGEYQDPGNWLVQETKVGAILSPTSFHALFVERGRRPGAKPPYEVIMKWAFQKKIGLRKGRNLNTSQTGTKRTARIVKAIQWKIAKKGTKGRWPLRRTLPKIAKRLAKEMKKAMDASIGKKPPKKRQRLKG